MVPQKGAQAPSFYLTPACLHLWTGLGALQPRAGPSGALVWEALWKTSLLPTCLTWSCLGHVT